MQYSSRRALLIIFTLLLTCGFAVAFNSERALFGGHGQMAFANPYSLVGLDACASPTPTPTPEPTPSLQPRNDEIVTQMSASLLIGAPGDTITLRGSLTNTASQPYTPGGSGLIREGGCTGNAPACSLLSEGTIVSSDPIAPNTSTGEIDIAVFKLNPAYTGPLPTVVKYTFYVERPGMFSGITTFSLRIQPRTDASQPPLLFTDPCTQRVAALDSATLTREPFALTNPLNFGPDQQTRVLLFAWNMNLQPGEGAAAVTVQAIDSQQAIHALPVEFVSDVAGEPGLTQIVVTLPADLPQGGDLRLRVLVHAFTSNEAPIAIQPS